MKPMKLPEEMREVVVREEVIGGRGTEVRAIRDAVLNSILAEGPGDTVRLDFGSVRILDFSAADEILSTLIRRIRSGELGPRRFILTGINDDVRESIVAVLQLRRLHCLEHVANELRLLGAISPELKQTLDYVNARGAATSNDLTKDLPGNVEINTASNRLKALAQAGLIVEDPTTTGGRGTKRTYHALIRA